MLQAMIESENELNYRRKRKGARSGTTEIGSGSSLTLAVLKSWFVEKRAHLEVVIFEQIYKKKILDATPTASPPGVDLQVSSS